MNWTPAWQARGSDHLTPQLGVTSPEFLKEPVSWLGWNLMGKVGAIVREVLAQGSGTKFLETVRLMKLE